jgi:hypothetical protein
MMQKKDIIKTVMRGLCVYDEELTKPIEVFDFSLEDRPYKNRADISFNIRLKKKDEKDSAEKLKVIEGIVAEEFLSVVQERLDGMRMPYTDPINEKLRIREKRRFSRLFKG